MTTHQAAKKLLDMPDVPLVIEGTGDDEGSWIEVTEVEELSGKYLAAGEAVERDGEFVILE